MKKSILTLAAVLFVAGTMLSNNAAFGIKNEKANAHDVTAGAKDAQNQAKKDTLSEFQKFKNEANKEINKTEKQLEKLREDMKKEKEEMRVKSKENIDALDRKNHELKVKLEGYTDDAKSDWREFKKEFRHDMD